MLGLGLIQLLVTGRYLEFVIVAVVLIGAITLHEAGHALAAELQGDPTPRFEGRLTLNPVKHMDPMGTIAIFLVGFGWGKPVPFSPRSMRSQRSGPAVVALAGPMVNVVLAFAGAIAYVALDPPPGAFLRFLGILIGLNSLLAVFNLIPLPPLDGSRILTLFLPPNRQNIVYFLDRWGFAILILLLLFGALGLIQPLVLGLQRAVIGFAELLIP